MLRFLKVTRTRVADRVRTLMLQVRGYGSEGADDEESTERQDDVELVQPLGLMARAVIASGLEVLAAEIGDQTVGLALLNKALSVLSLEEGETRLYGAKESTCHIRLRADGSIDIEAKSNADIRITASGTGELVLNGGALKVARDTDAVAIAAALATWMTNVQTSLNTLGQPVAALVGTTIGNISGGAARVKA